MNKLILQILTIALLISCCLSIQQNKASYSRNNARKEIVNHKNVESEVNIHTRVSFNSSIPFNTTLVSVNETLSFMNSTLSSLNSTISFDGIVYFNGTTALNTTALNATIHNIQDTLHSIRLSLEALNSTLVHMNQTLTWARFNETSLNASSTYYTFQPYWDSRCLFPGGGVGVAVSNNQQNITVFNQTAAICANFNLTTADNFTVQYFNDNNCTFANQSIHNETFVINECTYSPFLKAYYFIDLSTVKLPTSSLVFNYFNKSSCVDVNQEGFNYMNNHTVISYPVKPRYSATTLLYCNDNNVATNQTCITHNHKQKCTTEPVHNTCDDELRNYRITCA